MSYEYKVYNDNILNSADSLDDAVKFANECIEEYRDDAQDGWPEEVENVRIVMETHQPVQINLRPVDRCEKQYTDCEHSCDYELQPTAEWQSIQSQLSEHEWMKRCLVSMGVLCGDSGDLSRFVGENNETLQRIADEDLEIFPQAVGYSERISMKEIEKLRSQLKQIKSLVPDYTNPEGYCRQVRLLASLGKDGE